MKILFTGGGTGGHVVPILAVARELRRLEPNIPFQFSYVGPNDPFVRELLEREGIQVSSVPAGKIRRDFKNAGSVLLNLVDALFKTPLGILLAFFKLFFAAPDLVFSKGGYGALPVAIASWILGTPLFLHESDAVPGRANTAAARFATHIFTSFPRTFGFPQKKTFEIGNPVRTNLLSGTKERAQELFSLQGGKPVVLILGGSQGAVRLNDMVLASFPEMLKRFELIHQTGEKDFARVKQESRAVIEPGEAELYHPMPFLREVDLKHAYAAADIIVSRAGAGAIFELAALGKPSVLIPLPESAQDHQLKNAYSYAKTGGAIVLEAENLTPHFFLEKLTQLAASRQRMEEMAAAAKRFAKPYAAESIGKVILEYLRS